jgi:hypothetical protein
MGGDGGGTGRRPVFGRACYLVERGALDRLLVVSAGREENLSRPTWATVHHSRQQGTIGPVGMHGPA